MRNLINRSICTFVALFVLGVSVQAQEKSSEEIYTISLPNNGLIWTTEDSNPAVPVLQVVAPSYVSFSGVIDKPTPFYIRANYASFIDRYELYIYRAIDVDLIEPLVKIDVKSTPFAIIEWDGVFSDKYSHRAGDELVYVLKAYNRAGQFDETSPKRLQLLKPEDASKSQENLREIITKEQGVHFNKEDAQAQLLLNQAFGGNALLKQNIPISGGSKIILQGMNLPDGTLYINGTPQPVDFNKRFAAEYIVPIGVHEYSIDMRTSSGDINKILRVDVSGNYLFAVAIADFTLSEAMSSGDGKEIAGSDDLLKDGRLAFYTKGKIKGKYLFTAQADTTEKDIKHLFSGFTQAYAKDLFESLDPDMYYPTYGDDSTTFRDVNTQGRFYLRVDWDKNQALWGNFNTGFTGTEFAQYSRSLYGAALNYRSISNNVWGDAKTTVKAFGSEAQSAAGHNEFLGTGGSLYYLRHTDILPGSEKIVLEVKDVFTGQVIANIDLLRGADYEIDNIQGRIILSRPLAQIIRQNVASITSLTPLSGYTQTLIVDYEFVPSGFDDDSITAGIRAKHWINNYIAVGGTYVKEEQAGDDYEIRGVDLTLQAGKGTYLKTEYTYTKSAASKIFYSANGGFSFAPLGADSGTGIDGEAIAVEARINFKELNITSNDLSIATWYKEKDAGYSSSRSSSYGEDVKEYGVEAISEINKNIKIYSKVSKIEDNSSEFTQFQVTGKVQVTDKAAISAEVKHLDMKSPSNDTTGTLGALRFDYDVTSNLEVWATGQLTLDNDGGKYDNNDAVTLGTRYLYASQSSVGAEYITGHRGDALSVDISHEVGVGHTVYGGYTWSNEYNSDYNSLFGTQTNTGWTVGQRWALTNQISLYNESQFLSGSGDKGATNSLGMDFYLGEGWTTGFMYQKGELDSGAGEDVDRDAFSLSVGRTSKEMSWLSKLEYRQDRGAEDRDQWVSTNRLTYKVNESLRLAARFNYSDTDDNLVSTNGAKFIEGNFGFAYRPWDSDKWAFFGRYTYMYDLSSIGQVNGSDYDQKTQVVSFEGVYKINGKWEVALKIAERMGEARLGRGTGHWFDSRTTFYAAQVRYDLLAKWHALLEYRALDVKDGGVKQGVLIGLDRDITENFRIGAGYNFTDFSDDLTNYDYKYRGWYINVLGTY